MNLLILDEPTNHLDIESREALENARKDFDGTIICVSHDRYFTRQLATRFIDIGENGLDYRGGYDGYCEYKARLKAGKEDLTQYVQIESSQKDEYLERKKSNAERRKQEKHMKEVEREIGKLEHELVDIDDFLGSDEAGVDYVKAAELYDRKIVIEDRLMQLYEEEEAYAAEKEAENAENA